MQLAIVTNSDFIIPTWTEEKAKENEKYGRIFSDSIIPRTENAEKFLDKNYSFKLMPGIKNKNSVKGVYAGIKGVSYKIYKDGGNPFHQNTKTYPLEGYCIPCIITEDRKVYPILRDAKYDEKWVFFTKDDYENSKELFKRINNKEKDSEMLKETIKSSLNNEWPMLVEI